MGYCDLSKTSELDLKYHDNEWGVPLHDDRKQFEFLMMEVMQCGLNWNLILSKREVLRTCFDEFNYEKVALYTDKDVARIKNTPGMIRSEPKIRAVINNANQFIKIINEFGSFDRYIWDFAGGKTILYDTHADGYIPASNGLSEDLSKDLKKRGFKFVGPVTIYSHLQACGIINDHSKDCPCYAAINSKYPTIRKPKVLEKNIRFYK